MSKLSTKIELCSNSTDENPRRKQRSISGERDQSGRFVRNNPYRFKPGVSGNLRGRCGSITDQIRRQLTTTLICNGQSLTVAQAIVEQLIRLALSGNLIAIREILDRTEGKAHQFIDVAASDDKRRQYILTLEYFRNCKLPNGESIPDELALKALLHVHNDAADVLYDFFE